MSSWPLNERESQLSTGLLTEYLTGPIIAVLILLTLAATYLYLVNRQLQATRYKRTEPFPSDWEWLKKSEGHDADVLEGTEVATATHKRYVVTGGCGSAGEHFVEILQSRGERHIYILDFAEPPTDLAELDGVHFIKTDLRDREQVMATINEAKPDVVFHLASCIRFYDRLAYTYKYSSSVNIDGTRFLIEALQNADFPSEKLFLYCSSATVLVPMPYIMRLGFSQTGYAASYLVSDDRPIPADLEAKHCYAATKIVADKMSRAADGVKGITTGVIRPGMGVHSRRAGLFDLSMHSDTNPTFLGMHVQQNIDARDMTVAFLLYEKALRERPAEVRGDAFLVSGDQYLLGYADISYLMQLLHRRDFKFVKMNALLLYALGHCVEAYFYLRFHLLLWATGKEPEPIPRWAIKTQLFRLQPALFNTACAEVAIDDSRARKVLGYAPRYNQAQTIRWVLERIQRELDKVSGH